MRRNGNYLSKTKTKNNNVGKGKDKDEDNDRDNGKNSFPKEIPSKLITFSHNQAMGGVADSLFLQIAYLVEVVIEETEVDICCLFFCILQTVRKPPWLK